MLDYRAIIFTFWYLREFYRQIVRFNSRLGLRKGGGGGGARRYCGVSRVVGPVLALKLFSRGSQGLLFAI